ncbi:MULTISPECIES: DUF2971 domain-containing protein [unclassified Sphingobium]|uniref:DUF2971 domain-containing protein n=1 Tax=unclassified Sphingobium TaxID=2611147 RepID=UPI0022252C37|nr:MULTISPECIES: DUF2971 domain-containing protein [unclassified Sphingobium]MCW2395874.1 hypothetical protein [Sphingobium sp. B8D3B]MCW2419390.1 hypothetical protein [Sphingobium sp. B8D3C]
MDKLPTLYHFTNCEGGSAILSNGTMWFSEVRQLNDDTEISFGQKLFREPLLKWIENRFQKDTAKELINFCIRRFDFDEKTNHILSASFCQIPKNPRLWDEYAGKNTGIAIGFDPRAFTGMGNIKVVRYPDRSHNDLIDYTFRIFDRNYSSLMNKSWLEITPDAPRIISDFIALYVCTKEKKWKEERETRIVWLQAKPEYREFSDESRQSNGMLRYSKLLQRESGGKTVDYIQRDFREARWPNIPVREVVLGSNCKMAPREMLELLTECGYRGVQVTKLSNEIIAPGQAVNGVWVTR